MADIPAQMLSFQWIGSLAICNLFARTRKIPAQWRAFSIGSRRDPCFASLSNLHFFLRFSVQRSSRPNLRAYLRNCMPSNFPSCTFGNHWKIWILFLCEASGAERGNSKIRIHLLLRYTCWGGRQNIFGFEDASGGNFPSFHVGIGDIFCVGCFIWLKRRLS